MQPHHAALALVALCLVAGPASAPFEINTHQYVSLLAARHATNFQRFLSEHRIGDRQLDAPFIPDAFGVARTPVSLEGLNLATNRGTPSALVGLGAILEDSSPRWLHHFYDPRTGAGLTLDPVGGGPPVRGLPSMVWAYGSRGAATTPLSPGNGFGWTDAEERHWRALTTEDPLEREREQALLCRSLGQVIHLLQDAFQPSHTRNDSHSAVCGDHNCDGSSFLESWCRANVDATRDNLGLGLLVAGASTPFYGTQLFQYFDFAAGISNGNFFSDDTMRMAPPASIVVPEATGDYLRHAAPPPNLGNPHLGYSLPTPGRLLSPPNFHWSLRSPGDIVVRENATVLLAHAVVVSRTVLDHFFRGQLQLSVASVSGRRTIRVGNASTSTAFRGAVVPPAALEFRAGEVTVYYETTTGRVRPLPSFHGELSALGIGQHIDLDTTEDLVRTLDVLDADCTHPELRPTPDRRVLVVFRGTIGDEPAVASGWLQVPGDPNGALRIGATIPASCIEWYPQLFYGGVTTPITILWSGAASFPVIVTATFDPVASRPADLAGSFSGGFTTVISGDRPTLDSVLIGLATERATWSGRRLDAVFSLRAFDQTGRDVPLATPCVTARVSDCR